MSREIGAALGGRTLADVEALRPELALLGVCALDPVAGIAAFDPEDAEIKRALLRNSGRVAAAILNEKLETGAPFAIGRAESLDSVVLEADAPESVARAFAERGINVLRAQPARGRLAAALTPASFVLAHGRTNPNDRRASRTCP